MRVIKFLLSFIVIIVTLTVLAVVFVTNFVNPNDYKQKIEALAKKHANIELSIDGDIGWSFYPWLGFEVNQITINLPDTKSEKHFAQLAQAKAYLKLLPLLSKKVELSSISLRDLDLNLSKYADGTANWELITKSQDNTISDGSTNNDDQDNVSMTIDIEDISVVNANIHYKDLQQGQEYQLENVNIISENIQLTGSDFAISLAFNFAMPSITLQATFDTTLALDIENQRYGAKNLLAILSVNSDVTEKPIKLTLKGNAQFDQLKEILSLDQFSLDTDNLRLTTNLNGQQLLSTPIFKGDINLSASNLSQLLTNLGQSLTMSNDNALNKLELTAKLAGPSNSLLLKDLKLVLDSTTLTGELGWYFDSEKLLAHLTGDKLNLDHYLPAKDEQSTMSEDEKTEETQSSAPSSTPVPVEALRNLNLDIDLSLDELVAMGAKMANYSAIIKANAGVITIDHIKAELYGGNVKASGTINASGQALTMNIKKSIVNVTAEPLLKDTYDIDQLVGTLNMDLAINSLGNTVEKLLAQLNGSGQFNVTDGKLKEINVAAEVCKGISLVKQEPQPEQDWPNETPFDALQGSFTITKGVIQNEDLIISTPTLVMNGKGNVDLAQSTIDYQLATQIISNTEKEACVIDKKYQNKALPVRCNGKLSKLPKNCGPDINGFTALLLQVGKDQLIKDATKNLDEEDQEKVDNAKEQIKELGLDEKLKNIGIDVDQF